MITRAKSNIQKPNPNYQCQTAIKKTKYPIPETLEPTCVSQAMKIPAWKEAMASEFNALVVNGTWSLVPKNSAQNLVGNKWIFKVKRKADGSVERHKARLVAKGLNQRPGLDFKKPLAQS